MNSVNPSVEEEEEEVLQSKTVCICKLLLLLVKWYAFKLLKCVCVMVVGSQLRRHRQLSGDLAQPATYVDVQCLHYHTPPPQHIFSVKMCPRWSERRRERERERSPTFWVTQSAAAATKTEEAAAFIIYINNGRAVCTILENWLARSLASRKSSFVVL